MDEKQQNVLCFVFGDELQWNKNYLYLGFDIEKQQNLLSFGFHETYLVCQNQNACKKNEQ